MGIYEWYFVILRMQVQWWEYHEVVGTLKPYLMQNNLFELIALTVGGNARVVAPLPTTETPGETFTNYFWENQLLLSKGKPLKIYL